MIEVTDAIDRHLKLARPAKRVVSLVPSESVSVADLAGVARLVGRTDYCVEPVAEIDCVATVGGTKGFDVDAVKALKPDLVLANKEENSRSLVRALIAAGLPVHVSFPCTVEESLEYLRTLCILLGIDPSAAEPVRACRDAVRDAARETQASRLRVFVPIWRDPWMTFDGRVFASDVLALCGADNVFSGRPRVYPLSADLGETNPISQACDDARDTRYPRIRLSEVVEREARVVLLPDEPYAFSQEDAEVFSALECSHPLLVERVDGKDLFWYGSRVAEALPRLRDQIARLRAFGVGLRTNK